MTTGTKFVQNAYRRIGAHSDVAPAPAESLIVGFERLTSMLQLWQSWGIQLNFVPPKVIGDDIHEPPDSTNAIIDNLAIRCAPDFDNGESIVSVDLKNEARMGLEQIKTLYQKVTIPKKIPSSNLPVGSGNSRGQYRRTFFGRKRGLDA